MKASHLDGRTIRIDNEDFLYFYGTSYLGLPYDEQFKKLLIEGQDKYGSSLGSSPLSSPQLEVYGTLENTLAEKYGFESALIFASGYSAGQTIVQLFEQQDYHIVYGNIAHPALKLERKILKQKNLDIRKRTFYAVDYIDPITFELGDLTLAANGDDFMLVDASHGLGLFDDEIRSLSERDNLIVCGSLNKALGINAGVVLCGSSFKNQLQSTNRYITSSVPSPGECHALQSALNNGLIQEKKSALRELVSTIPQSNSYRTQQSFPVISFQNNQPELYDHLKSAGILIWHNKYPTSNSPLVNRAVVTGAHKKADLEQLLNQINVFGK